MTRCEEFYEKWKRDPNWCDKCPTEVFRINKYIESLDMFPSLKQVSASALRLILEKKLDINTRKELLKKVADQVEAGKEVHVTDVVTLMTQFPKGNKEAQIGEIPKVEQRIIHAATWKETMHPTISRMDEEVYNALCNARVPSLFQERIPVKWVTPDILIQSRSKNIAVFLDGPVHEGHEDRDRENRQLLAQRDITVLEYKYDEYSLAQRDQIVNEILSYLGMPPIPKEA